ncbi:serine/threonine-protein kinase Nek7-like isoform X2 [Hibiscus syriacus]|uniref:Serine/threonine-protein kinase Nek7-like isoform X2 n=1 Tax=Hibiscus syriacus TaxID=106335 RepID=A0A6A2ZTC8_HIBSY|nr:serine/threonine-protein kinase Nek7-like isoform X2 [Hibiscus syriacus]
MGKRKHPRVSRDEEEEVEIHSSSNEKSLYEEAKEKFQQLQKVISILGDEEKRVVYDQTGCVDDADLAGDVVENLKTFFKAMLFCSMLCSDPKLDLYRFKDFLDEAIAAGELKETKAYQKWAKKVSEIKPPTSPLRRKKSERKDRFDSMFSSLVSKYGVNADSEPTDEEFRAALRKVENRKSKKSKCK